MQDKAILTLGSWGFGTGWSFGLACALSAACAGGDTPQRDDTTEGNIAIAYAGRQQTANAGSTGMGTGGSSSGTGGSGSGTGGSTTQVEAGAGGTASGGSAGSGDVAEGGSSGSGSTAGGCDGFAIIELKCGGGSCHGGPSGGFLSGFAASEDQAATYAGQPSMTCSAQGDNADIFNPDNPGASLVLQKIAGTSACGSAMPLGSPANSLPPEDIDCIEEWIGSL